MRNPPEFTRALPEDPMSITLTSSRALAARTSRLLLVTAPSLGGRGGQFLALTLLALLVTPVQYGHFVALQTLLVGTASVLGSTSAVAINAATARVVGARNLPVLDLVPAMLRGRRRVFVVGATAAALIVPAGRAPLMSPSAAGFALVTGTAPSTVELAALAALGLMSGALPAGDALVAVVAGSGRYLAASTLDAGRALVGAGAALGGVLLLGPVGGGLGLVVSDLVLVLVLAVTVATSRRPPVAVVSGPGRPREGMLAGVVANVAGQTAAWVLLLGVQVVGGGAALGLWGVASRFASLVTLAPVYFGKTVVGQLGDDAPADRRWTPRSFLVMLTGVSVIAAALALAVLVIGFPGLVDRYAGLVPVTSLLLAGMVARAVLIGAGYVCVARRRWRTWVVADLVSLAVTVLGVVLVWAAAGGVVGMVLVFGVGNVAGVAVRLVGSRQSAVTR
jgi:hypothetical protein